MPDDTTETTQPKTPQPVPGSAEKLADKPPHNYDGGLPPPGLQSPSGQETPPT